MDNATSLYCASIGPDLDPIPCFDPPGVLEVVAKDDPGNSLGQAQLAGWLLGGRRPIATYRLMIGGGELPGLFIRVGRRFELVVA